MEQKSAPYAHWLGWSVLHGDNQNEAPKDLAKVSVLSGILSTCGYQKAPEKNGNPRYSYVTGSSLHFLQTGFLLHHFWRFQESKYELNMKIGTLNQRGWPPEILQTVSQPISPASKKHESYCNERHSKISKQIPLETLIWGEEIRGLSPAVGDNLVGLQEKIAWAVDKRRTPAAEHYTNPEDAEKMPEFPGVVMQAGDMRYTPLSCRAAKENCRIRSITATVGTFHLQSCQTAQPFLDSLHYSDPFFVYQEGGWLRWGKNTEKRSNKIVTCFFYKSST